METKDWIAIIGAIGTVLLQLLHMYLSYRRDAAIKADTGVVAKAANGLTERIVTAELTAEKVVAKAEVAAHDLLTKAAVVAAAKENK